MNIVVLITFYFYNTIPIPRVVFLPTKRGPARSGGGRTYIHIREVVHRSDSWEWFIGVVHRSGSWASLNTDSTATARQCEWFIRMILCSESPATFQVGIADNHCIDMTDVTGYHGK